MTRHIAIMRLPSNEVDRINRLLSIPSLEEMTDDELREIGATTDSVEGIFYVDFDDGSSLNFDLCSGRHNYFDNVEWTNANETTTVLFDCAYELDDIEFEVDDELYIVKIIKE